jgi:hypothetical protein
MRKYIDRIEMKEGQIGLICDANIIRHNYYGRVVLRQANKWYLINPGESDEEIDFDQFQYTNKVLVFETY